MLASLAMPTILRRAGFVTVIAASLWTASRAAVPVQASKPNILFILADDLDAAELAFMPKLKAALINQGTSFSNYFVNVSLCCPSRTTTIRGQYASHTGVMTNGGGNGGFETAYAKGVEQSTIATWLSAAGYRTALYGKYLNGYPDTAPQRYIPAGWTSWASAIGGNPYSEYNYQLNADGRPERHLATPADYGTDVYAAKADAFIRKAASDARPFFVYLAVYAPHAPATPAPRHQNLFDGAKAPRPPSFNEDDVSDKPAYVRSRPKLGPRQVEAIDALYRKRLQSLQAVDEAIASLIDTLKATNQLDRTFIVFASDNGFHMGQHRLQSGKQTAYEEDIHVPLVIRGPGVPSGKAVASIAGNVDLAPTFAAIGDVAVPEFVDGRSLMPLLKNGAPPANWRQAYLVEHWQQDAATAADDSREPVDADQVTSTAATPAPRGPRGGARAGAGRAAGGRGAEAPAGIPEFHGVRTAQYVYVEYATGERELYDITKDPYELNNLAPKASASLLQVMADQLAHLRACAGASCR